MTTSKIASMHDAIAGLVRDGDAVAIEGFTHLICFAAGYEIIRQGKRDLTVLANDTAAPGRRNGKLISAGLGKKGVYRDERGGLRAVSLRCTHLGCLLRFNAAERSWDCPCHGSRFATDGSVIHGPATAALERKPGVRG